MGAYNVWRKGNKTSEENYPINLLEQAAIVEGYKDNYHMLFDRECYIYCDNKPSIERAAKTEKSFFSILQDLVSQTNSRIYYLPGNKQIMADFLSRYHAPQIMAIDTPLCDKIVYLEHIVARQENDDELHLVKNQIAAGSPITTAHFDKIKENMFVHDGAVMVRLDGKDLVVIPFKDREEFVANTHQDALIPHLGAEKLIHSIRRCAFVLGLTQIVKEVISKCERCMQNIVLHKANQTFPIQPMPVSINIGERWHTDLWGVYRDNYRSMYVIGAVEALTKFMVAKSLPISKKEPLCNLSWMK